MTEYSKFSASIHPWVTAVFRHRDCRLRSISMGLVAWLCLVILIVSAVRAQDETRSVPHESTNADQPSKPDTLNIPKIEETKLSSPIFGMLMSNSTGSLQIAVMPDFFGGNARRGLDTWDNTSIQKVLKLTDGQIYKIEQLKKALSNDLRREMKIAMKNVEHLYQAHDFQKVELQKTEEAFSATLDVLTAEQKDRYTVLERRSRLVLLGWEFVFTLLERDPSLRIPTEVRKKLETILLEKREHFQKLTDERFAKFLSGLDEVLTEDQVATVAKMVGSGKYVIRPIIEELASQLNTESQDRFDLEKDRLALLRRQKMLGLDGAIYDKFGSGGSQTGNLARDVIVSAFDKIDLLGDPGNLYSDWVDTSGPYSKRLQQRQDETLSAEGAYHRGEIAQDVMYQRINAVHIEFDNYMWKEVMGDLIPGLKHQVEQHLIQLEIQAIGFPTALTKGHLAKHVLLTGAQRRHLDEYYEKTREAILKDTHAWTLELENEIRPLLTKEQVQYLQTELSAFDNDTVIYGTPMLMLLPRLIHFPQ